MAIARFYSALLTLLILFSPTLHVVRSQSDESAAASEVIDGVDLGIVNDETQVFGDSVLTPAPGIKTICLFPKNPSKSVTAGEEAELLVGLHNEGDAAIKINDIHATLHLPFDHNMFSQNLTFQEISSATVPASAQATFPYTFSLNKFLQPGSYDLVGYINYEIDTHPYQSVFYNGTIEVIESGNFLSIESVFLFSLGVALLAFLGFWVYGQMQHFSKKTKRVAKVEVGTRNADADMDEWLEGTAYAQSIKKGKKKK